MDRRPKWTDDAPLRIAPGTVVMWFDGLTRKTGRVKHNLPGVNRKPGAVVVTTADGAKVVLPVRRVIVRKDGV